MLYADDVPTRALDEFAASIIARHIAQQTPEDLGAVVGALGVGDEVQAHRAALEDELLDAEVTPQTPQLRYLDERLGSLGQRPEAVDHAPTEGLQLRVLRQPVQLAIQEDALAVLRHVVLGEAQLEVTLYLRLHDEAVGRLRPRALILLGVDLGELVGLELAYCLIEDLLVGLVSHVGGVSR